MNSVPMQQTPDHCALELAYEKSLRQTDVVYDEEKMRQLRLHILLLEDDNDHLHEQLTQGDDRIDELDRLASELQDSRDAVRGSLETAQSDLRLKSREIETLKIELSSLHEVTMDSTKLLTEKLALARELSSLKPEIDHLRSQALSHQTMLSEKLSLQRQLSALQSDLEMEKRARERAVAKEGKSQADEARVAKQIETLQAEADKERRERQKIERESQKVSADWETKLTTLESRLDGFRTKLKTTKEQLKESQAALHTARSATQAGAGRSISDDNTRNAGKEARKRTASLMEDDTMIGTPGNLQAAKKSKRASTLPGDKSTFSITPFLNRTVSVAPGHPPRGSGSSDAGQVEDAAAASEPEDHMAKEKRAPSVAVRAPFENSKAGKGQKASTKPTILEKTRPGKTTSRAPRARKPRSAPALEQVTEEANNEDVGPTFAGTGAAAESDVGNEAENLEAKKRRRKLLAGGLGKTLFDDYDGEAIKGRGVTNGGGRAFGSLGRVTLGGPKACPRFDGSASGFSGFSPLKKDRKASAA